ncbi:MAG TPA: Gfo/Idh/MocA family oxidoreductase [bacterium]|nr:Gfo/Idh/MocA family oxidoreductase [bacterium]
MPTASWRRSTRWSTITRGDRAEAAARDKARALRVLVVGLGSIGRRHAANLRALGVTALAGYDPGASVPEVDGLRRVGSLEDGLAWGPDVVFVATPTHLHMQAATAAANLGCHLFIEKPLAHTAEGTESLRAAVERGGLITLVGCNMRFHPGPAEIKRLIDDGAVGTVIAARIQTGSYLPGWRPWMDYRSSYSAHAEQGGGAILDCIHELDLARWYFGPGRVLGAAVVPARTLGLEIEGVAEILIRHDSGVLSSVHLNVVQRDYRRGCQVIGERGTLYWDYEHPVVTVSRGDASVTTHALPAGWAPNQAYVDEVAGFLRCVRTLAPTVNPIEDALATLSLALTAKAMAGSVA